MNEERVREVFGDEEFVKGLLELETPGEVCAAVREKGIEMTEDDVIQIRELLLKRASGELSEEELEDVAGGIGMAAIVVGFLVVMFATPFVIGLMNSGTRGRW